MSASDKAQPSAYGVAVETLMEIAIAPTGGGRVAAQVLLSAYNGNEFHLDVTDLRLLDRRYLHAALVVMAEQASSCIEPQTVIDNGQARFNALWEQWSHLRSSVRFAKGY